MSHPLLLLLIALAGCAGRGSSFEEVKFRAPSQPDPALAPFLEEVDHIGVICVTNIEPFRELDIEKVMARLSTAVARGLGFAVCLTYDSAPSWSTLNPKAANASSGGCPTHLTWDAPAARTASRSFSVISSS